jgi:hypothetical protein
MNFIVWFSTFLDAKTAVVFAMAAFVSWLAGWKRGAIAFGGIAALMLSTPLWEEPLVEGLLAMPTWFVYAVFVLVVLKSAWIILATLFGVKIASNIAVGFLLMTCALLLSPLILLTRSTSTVAIPQYLLRALKPKERLVHVSKPCPFALHRGPSALLTERLVLTNQRLLHVRGILSKNVVDIPRRDIISADVRQSLWARLWGRGDVSIKSRHRAVMTFFDLIDPFALRKIM